MAEGGALQSALPWHAGVLDPQGAIGVAERTILLNATAIMLAVIIPVIVLTLVFAWWFRSGNRKARYLPDWSYSGRIELVTWSIPALIIMFLGGIAWISAHDLDPAVPIRSSVAPIDIEVVSLDWKWLFIYPDQAVASVNLLVVPAGTPIRFRLTSASVMNSFFVPQLGSQIYTMPRMTTRLNLMAERPGNFSGLSAQFSGDGFSDMRFDVVALRPDAFNEWLIATRAHGGMLDAATYTHLAQAGSAAAPATFGNVAPHLFEVAVMSGATASAMPPIAPSSGEMAPQPGN